MSYQEDFDIAQRYDLLCRASQSHVEQDGQRLQLAADLDVFDKSLIMICLNWLVQVALIILRIF